MTPYKQLVKHDPKNGQYGDCARTCIACLLDLPPRSVPHLFENGMIDGEVFWQRMDEWLAKLGLKSFGVPYDADVTDVLKTVGHYFPETYYMLGAASRTADHFVIAKGDKIVHDPAGHSPDSINRGSDGFVWVYVFIPLFLQQEKPIPVSEPQNDPIEIEREACAKICETFPLEIDERKWSDKTDQYVIRVAEAGCRNAFATAIRARKEAK